LLFAWLLLPVKSHFTVTTSYILLYIIAYQRDTHIFFILSSHRRGIKRIAHFAAKSAWNLSASFREIGAGAEDEPFLRVGHNSHVIHSQPRGEYLQMGFKSGREVRGGGRRISFAGT